MGLTTILEWFVPAPIGFRIVCLRASSSDSSMARLQTSNAFRTSPDSVEIFAAKKEIAAGLIIG